MFKKRNIKTTGIDITQIKEQKDQQINGQPKKRLKIQKPQITNSIGGSTSSRKIQNQKAVHKQFQNLAYKKGTQQTIEGKILTGEQAINHETQQAKNRYLENIQMTKKIKEGKISTKIYRGMNSYANYKLSQNQLQNPLQHYQWKHGPTRPGTNQKGGAKNTCRFDYDPSLCKDWHDSGYCVFGNSCLYLHDRSNYKTGWQLQKDFQKSERQRWKRIINPDVNQQPDFIKQLDKYKPQQNCKHCSQKFKDPMQVSCKHIFCRKCINQILDKDSKCPQCNKRLNGIMNNAEKILQKQKQNYQQMFKTQIKNIELSKIKKTRHKDINSLDVFTAQ